MAAEPVSFRLGLMIAEAEQAIKDTDDALAPSRAGNKPIPRELLVKYYRLHQHRHALELQRTYPQAVVLTDVRFTMIMDMEGQGHPIRVKKGQGRIADAAVVYGDRVWLIEEKVRDEVLKAFPAGSKTLTAAKILRSSKAGMELTNEQRILKQAARRGVYVAMSGIPILGGPRIEVLPEVSDVSPSHLQVYKNMGDGLPVPSGAPKTKMAGAGKALSALEIVARYPAPSIRAITSPPSSATGPPKATGVPVAAQPKATGVAAQPTLSALPASSPATSGKARPSSAGSAPTPTTRGAVLQPPVRGTTFIATVDRGADRTYGELGHGRRLQWPSNPSGAPPPPRASTLQRAAGATGGVAAAIQQLSENLTKKGHQAVWDRAIKAAGERTIHRKVEDLRNGGFWVRVSANFWHDKPDLAQSAHVWFGGNIGISKLADLEGTKDEAIVRESPPAHWSPEPDVANQRWAPMGSAPRFRWREKYYASSHELALYPPNPKYQVIVEDIPKDKLKMGRCIRQRLQ